MRRALELDGGGAGVLGQPQRRREGDDVLVEESGLARRVDRRSLYDEHGLNQAIRQADFHTALPDPVRLCLPAQLIAHLS